MLYSFPPSPPSPPTKYSLLTLVLFVTIPMILSLSLTLSPSLSLYVARYLLKFNRIILPDQNCVYIEVMREGKQQENSYNKEYR